MLDSPLVKKLIQLAFEEDLSFGDITTKLCVDKNRTGAASIIAKQDLIVCGAPLVRIIFDIFGWPAKVKILKTEGRKLRAGEKILNIESKLSHLLSAERTILNFLQRMSGVATYTKDFVERANGTIVLDTRKTIPGWRVLDKYAVSIGGGKNHRANLGDMILVKNNHIDTAPGKNIEEKIEYVLLRAMKNKNPRVEVEVEVRNLKELRLILNYKVDRIMLDNMNNKEIGTALGIIKEKNRDIILEISGGVNTERLGPLRKLGVTLVSVGSLTTQASQVDISMSIVSKG